jgi:hypothetical protein
VKQFPDAPLYDELTLRTFFLSFEDGDWEQELAAFKNTDVEVPATLEVDGQTYKDVGVHFRGMTSFMGVGEGQKRSLNLSLDFIHEGQQIGGYRTLNLLNSHEDSSFLRTVLYSRIAREYIPAAKANFVRVVINGENWGIYVSSQQVNKDFLRDNFNWTKGARWKVPGSPGGRGTLAYLGDAPAPYQRIYEIKSKDSAKSWASLIRLCKVLNETAAVDLEAALSPLLDIDGVLKFLALENALINNDGYWIRSSDYYLCEDDKGRFHLVPHDVNESFRAPGGPGFGPGPGGRGPRFGPGLFVAPQLLEQADRNGDRQLTKNEFASLADAWFDKLDPSKAGNLDREQFTSRLADVLPPPQWPGREPNQGQTDQGPGPGRRVFGPAMFIGPALFAAADGNKDNSVTRLELKETFVKWAGEWDKSKSGRVSEEALREGLSAALIPGGFGGPDGPSDNSGRGPGGGQRERRWPGGPGFGGMAVNGVALDPLIAANSPDKPLISRLLAVPALRARYLAYVRDVAENWLDWAKLGPLATQYHELIAEDVKADTRKLESLEEFDEGLDGAASDSTLQSGLPGPGNMAVSLKDFAQKRRAYLLNHAEIKKLPTSGS